MHRVIVERATSNYVPSLVALAPTPIYAVSERRMLVKSRMQITSLLHRSSTQPLKIDDLEAVVHCGDEEALGVGRMPFDSPDTSSSVKLGERDLRLPAIEKADFGVVAEAKNGHERRSEVGKGQPEGLPSNGEDVLKQGVTLNCCDSSFEASLIDECRLVATLS